MGNWKKEISRDIIALGGIPFFLMILVRLMIGEGLRPYFTTLYYFGFVALLFFALHFFVKHPNYYVSRSFALLVFSSLHYVDLYFTLFSSFLWLCLIAALKYRKTKTSEILSGTFVGVISSFGAYYAVNYLVVALNLPL